MEIQAVKNKTRELEFNIRKLIQDFHEDNKECELEINISPVYSSVIGGKTFLTSTGIEIKCII